MTTWLRRVSEHGPCLLGIDVGSSSTKAVLTTPSGEIVRTASRSHTLSQPRPGWVEHDADAVWWTEIAELARELTAPGGEVATVCVSGIGPCLLALDAHDRPLRPAILYGIDTRSEREIAELTGTYGADAILARSGSALTSQAVGPKLLWLRRNEPDVWQRTRRFAMASSYAVLRLSGAYVLDRHSASQCDPLYDIVAGDWAADWADDIAPGLELPSLAWPAEIVGAVTIEAAEATGLRAGTPVCAGTIDAWAEAHSAGVRTGRDFMLMYGTTMFMLQVGTEPLAEPRLWTTVGISPGTITYAGGLATSGALTGWLREIAGGVPYDELLDGAGRVPAGSDGLVALPYFAGERTPIHDPAARGVIAGLTLRHGRDHVYRALLEASAYGIRHALEAFDEAVGPGRRIVAVGGGASRELWTQIVSDVTGEAQEVPRVTIGAAYGDALLAAQAAGLADANATWATHERTVEPDASVAARYDELYEIYGELRESTRNVQHRLARLAAGALEPVGGRQV
ncbi:MAG TPA: FGGY family carbohydrate kinase [Gaiellales bacterium]|nr:FGGY family carbohydrate kinase [Gaiellales bacterium]